MCERAVAVRRKWSINVTIEELEVHRLVPTSTSTKRGRAHSLDHVWGGLLGTDDVRDRTGKTGLSCFSVNSQRNPSTRRSDGLEGSAIGSYAHP